MARTKFILKVFAVSQIDVVVANVDHLPGPQLMRASIRFVASVGALIGVSLLLACV
jgi:hypothetical protein